MGNAVGGVGAGGGAVGAEAPADMTKNAGDQTAQMQQMFAQAQAENAKITGIQTEGNTAKRAASAAPN